MRLLDKNQALAFVLEHGALFDHAEPSNPFAGKTWTLNFINEIAKESWTFLVPNSPSDPRSLMLLYRDQSKPQQLLTVANYYSSLCSPFISAVDSSMDRCHVLEGLVDQLRQTRPRWGVMNFSPLDRESPDTKNLFQALSSRGWITRQYDCFGNWYLPCENLSFDEYMKGRDSKLFNTWTRKKRKFERPEGDATRLEIVTSPEDVQRAVDAYEIVYAKSWKKPEPYPTFVRNWAHACAKNGWLRLGIAWMGQIPIAAQFWFTLHRRAYIFKLAYDEEHSKLSAGTVLSALMFKHALDQDRVVEIDYLTGDDAYKRSWVTHRRQRIGVVACNPLTVHGLLAGAKELAAETRRRWRQRRRQDSDVQATPES